MARTRKKPKGFQLRSWAVGIAIVVSSCVFLSYAVYHIIMAAEAESTSSPLPQLGDYTSPEAKAAHAVALEYAASIRRSKNQPQAVINADYPFILHEDTQPSLPGQRAVPTESKRLPSTSRTEATQLSSHRIIDNVEQKDSSSVNSRSPIKTSGRGSESTSSSALKLDKQPPSTFNLSNSMQPKNPNQINNEEDRRNNKPDVYVLPGATTHEVSGQELNFGRDDGRGPFGTKWRPVSDLSRDDWVVYLRIQKTGSQTFWQTLQQEFDAGIWGRKQTCQKGLFCGFKCLSTVHDQIKEVLESRQTHRSRKLFLRRKDANQCSLIFRGHINWDDYAKGFARAFSREPPRVFYMTFLREPVSRAVSEFRHITEGLVAQFGPHTFGAAWDYNFTFNPSMPIKEKRRIGTFANWMKCSQCHVGVSNRLTRFLGSSETTGKSLPEELYGDLDALEKANANMLRVAKSRLWSCAFIGIMERYEDSMLVLKHTFPQGLKRMISYATNPHPKTGKEAKLSEFELQQLREANSLDIQLYDDALKLFDGRLASMISSLPPESAGMRFSSKKTSKSRAQSREVFRLG